MVREQQHEVLKHLKKSDPILAKIIAQVPPFEKTASSGDYFFELVDAIISQQLSIKASATILKRFIALFPGGRVSPLGVINLSNEEMRSVGISYQKISYLKDLAQKTEASGIVFEQFRIMTDEEIIEELTKVKGIGRWTAEMFLMFAMNRQDVFSYGDLGIRNAIKKWYGFEVEPTKEEAENIAERWRPYRTTACRYLWRSLELIP